MTRPMRLIFKDIDSRRREIQKVLRQADGKPKEIAAVAMYRVEALRLEIVKLEDEAYGEWVPENRKEEDNGN